MSAVAICPVCRWPAHSGARCERCGWERLGATDSPADAPGWQARLTSRQRDYDVDAAARAANSIWPVDPVLLGALAAVVRGGPVRHGRIEQAMTTAARSAVTRPGMSFALTRLISGKTSAIAFIEIGPDTLSLQTLTVDGRGVPVPRAAESRPWTAIFPSLPVHIGLRYLRMAGGVGVSSSEHDEAVPAALSAAGGQNVAPVLTRLVAAADGPSDRLDIVLVHRVHGWPLLDAAAARARAMLRPVTEITAGPAAGPLADVVDAVAAQAPLRYGYDLILVEASPPDGAVRPRSYELFPPGAAAWPGPRPVRTVEVSPVKGFTAARLALPIVASCGPVADLRDAAALADRRPLITMAWLDATAGRTFRLRVELAGPGQVQLLPVPGLLRGGTPEPIRAETWPGWPEVIETLPRQTQENSRLAQDLDLVLLVELGAARDKEDVAARVRLSKSVVRQFHQVPGAEVAVLGYRDHYGDHYWNKTGQSGQEEKALIVGSTHGFSPPNELRAMFRRPGWWDAVPVGHDHAAPVEEALWLLAKDMWKWRPGVRHVVLIIGRRPPHPPRAQRSGVVLRCKNRLSWREALDRLRRHQVDCLAVLDDDPPARGYAANTWKALTAPEGYRTARGTTAQALARYCGLVPGPRSELPLATLSDGESFPATGQEGAQ